MLNETLEFRATEMERRIANMVLKGTIEEARYTNPPQVRVRAGDLVTDWLPWTTARAGADRTWCPPEVGEQVMIHSPSGEVANGVVVAALYCDASPAPGDRATVWRTEWADGARHEYDREAHVHALDLRACAGAVRVMTGAAETLVEPDRIELRVGSSVITITDGNITIRAGRIDLNP